MTSPGGPGKGSSDDTLEYTELWKVSEVTEKSEWGLRVLTLTHTSDLLESEGSAGEEVEDACGRGEGNKSRA